MKKFFLLLFYTIAALTITIQILFVLRFHFGMPINLFEEFEWLHTFALLFSSLTLITVGLSLIVFGVAFDRRKNVGLGILILIVGIGSVWLWMWMIQSKNY